MRLYSKADKKILNSCRAWARLQSVVRGMLLHNNGIPQKNFPDNGMKRRLPRSYTHDPDSRVPLQPMGE